MLPLAPPKQLRPLSLSNEPFDLLGELVFDLEVPAPASATDVTKQSRVA
jgi:hypothetical protein